MKKLVTIFLCLWSTIAFAHKPSDSYLSINIKENSLTGRWDIALRDLDFAIGLDNNGDGAITWGELRSKRAEIEDYVFARLQLRVSDDICVHQNNDLQVDEHTDGKYAVLFFNGFCGDSLINQLTITYRLFADLDPQHRGLLNLTHDNINSAAVLVPSQLARLFNLESSRSPGSAVLDFIVEGIWHIWMGFDHILFLFSLLIPSVMEYRTHKWQPVAHFKNAFWDVFKVVTAFTLAHSITLSLAVLDVLKLPSRWVESCIAASVILAALNNIYPLFTSKRAQLAFVFGLVHGFGFATVLTDLGLNQSSRLLSLLGFNLGVEIGQFALVLAFLPIAYKFSRYPDYQPIVLKSCSLGIAALACVWLYERAFEIIVI